MLLAGLLRSRSHPSASPTPDCRHVPNTRNHWPPTVGAGALVLDRAAALPFGREASMAATDFGLNGRPRSFK